MNWKIQSKLTGIQQLAKILDQVFSGLMKTAKEIVSQDPMFAQILEKKYSLLIKKMDLQ